MTTDADAVSAKTGKPAVNYYKKPYSTRGSGYTAAQMNIKVLDYDTNIELQYRDEGTSEFAEKEHVPYDISVPNLTYKELSVLNKNMPEANFPIKEAEFFQEDEVEAFKKIYRYYPATFEMPNLL